MAEPTPTMAAFLQGLGPRWTPPFGGAMPQSDEEREHLSWRSAMPYLSMLLPPVATYQGAQDIFRDGTRAARQRWRTVLARSPCPCGRCRSCVLQGEVLQSAPPAGASTNRALAARIHEPVAPGEIPARGPPAGMAT